MQRQVQRQLPRVAFVVLAAPAVALERARAHDQALGAQRDQLPRQRETRRPRLVDAVHAKTALEQPRHTFYQCLARHALRRLWTLAPHDLRHHLPPIRGIDANKRLAGRNGRRHRRRATDNFANIVRGVRVHKGGRAESTSRCFARPPHVLSSLTLGMKKTLALAILAISALSAVAADGADHEAKRAFSEYWIVLSRSFEGFFRCENQLLQQRFFEGKTPTAEEVEKKRVEIFTLSETIISDLEKTLAGRSAREQQTEIDSAADYFSSISLWAASGGDGQQQLQLYRAHDLFRRKVRAIRVKFEEKPNQSSQPTPGS